jgi:hypothetical protein
MKTLSIIILAAAITSCADYPVTGTLQFRDPKSGAKGGMTFIPGQTRPDFSLRVPIYDDTTGELLGYGELASTPKVEGSK